MGYIFCCCFGKGNVSHGARCGEGGECLERWYLLLSPDLADWNRFIHRRFVVAQKPTAILCICLETSLMPKLRFVRTWVLIFYTFPSVFIVTWLSDFPSSSTSSLPVENLSAHSNTRAIDRLPSPYASRNKCKYPVALICIGPCIILIFPCQSPNCSCSSVTGMEEMRRKLTIVKRRYDILSLAFSTIQPTQ